MIIVLGIEKREEERRDREEEERGKSALTLAANEAQTIEVGGGTKGDPQSKYDSNHENSSGKIMDNEEIV